MRPTLLLVGATCLAGVLSTAVSTAPAAPASAPVTWTCAGRAATIVGTSEGDVLVGTPGPDVIVGLQGADRIRGLGGDDVICGDDGSDTLRGGRGDDYLAGGRGQIHSFRGYHTGDRFRGGAGDDVFDVGGDPQWPGELTDTISFTRAPRGVHVDLAAGTARGEGHDRIVGHPLQVGGSRYDDVIVGGPLGEYLYGWRGDDRVRGRGGDDLVSGDASLPGRVDKSHGDDILRGGAGDDEVTAARGSDLLSGGPGDDRLTDAWFDDNGIDVLDTPGRDRLVGGKGDDRVLDVVSASGEYAAGGPGRDRLRLASGGGPWEGVPVVCRAFERVRDPFGSC